MASIIKCPGCGNEIAITLRQCMLCGFKLNKADFSTYEISLKDEINDLKNADKRFSNENNRNYNQDYKITDALGINKESNNSNYTGASFNYDEKPRFNSSRVDQTKYRQTILLQALNEENTSKDYVIGFIGGVIGIILFSIASIIVLYFLAEFLIVFGRQFAEYCCGHIFLASIIVGAYAGGSFAIEIFKKSKNPYFSFRSGGMYGGYIAGIIVSIVAAFALSDFYSLYRHGDLILLTIIADFIITIIGIYYGSKLQYEKLLNEIKDPDYVYKYFSDRG